MADKLFYKDPYKREFDAVVDKIVSKDKNDRYGIILDRTCFYPEGGGQPADRGVIEGVPIVDVRKDDDRIVHFCDTLPPFAEGGPVHCKLDWEHRYDFMQQHSGQHLISAAFYQLEDIHTVSVHLGEQYSTVELDIPEVDDDILQNAERWVNYIISRNVPVQADWLTDNEIAGAGLRREPKVSGSIRVVSIEDVDRAACGGVHVGSTGEIGLVALIGTETIRGHVRTIWKIGDRGFKDYAEKTAICARLGELLSVPQDQIVEAAERLMAKAEAERKRGLDLDIKRAESVADSLVAGATEAITCRLENEEAGFVKSLSASILEKTGLPFSIVNAGDKNLTWCIGGAELDEDEGRRLVVELMPIIDGKGGGRPPMWQGAGNKVESGADFLEGFRKSLEVHHG